MVSAIYQVIGLTCEHCVHAVTEELTNLGGVTGVTVDLVPGGKSAVTVTSEAPLAELFADSGQATPRISPVRSSPRRFRPFSKRIPMASK